MCKTNDNNNQRMDEINNNINIYRTYKESVQKTKIDN